MSTIIGKIKFATLFILVLVVTNSRTGYAASAIRASNPMMMENILVYERSVNPVVGITPQANAIGYSFIISDQKGRIIISGTIKSEKTFYVSTKNLRNGTYRFSIGNHNVQEFKIR